MAHERLGLFDTPPDRQEIGLSLAVVGLLFAILMLAFPQRDIQLGEINVFVPLVDAFMLFSELIIASLLYSQATVYRSRALTVLASGYSFAALILIPHALTFPGAFSTNGLLGAGINTTAWLAVFRRFTFPIAVISYALLKSADSVPHTDPNRPAARVWEALGGAIVLAALVAVLTTAGHDLLPPIFSNSRDTVQTNLVIVNLVTILLTISAMALLFRQDKSVLDLWLLVALSGWIFQSLLNLTLRTRFTLGWYGLNVMTLASSFIVMLALITESNRLYARLAFSTAARNRERDARLMSVDAVAAAIAHEVGQPLTAANLNASAALSWLTRPKPDSAKAVGALHEAVDSGRRTFDVIRSIRSTFTNAAGTLTEFSLNDLALETASLMDRELAARKVSLQLSLDDSLPPVCGNRVQVQRVLINLLTNAIESLATTRVRARSIAIQSARLDGGNVQLDVSDSGVGVSPEKMAQIFEPFFTTKSTGTGLGLFLSRTIIEEHGGRLWVSSGENGGTTFHVQMKGHADPKSYSS